MTIAAGFLCADGIVLGADTLYSGINKRYAAKIWTLPLGNVYVAFAAAGVAVSIGRVFQELRRRLNVSMSVDDIIEEADDVLGRLAQKLAPMSDNDLPSLLMAIRAPGRYALLENDGNVILTHVLKPSQCVGTGASLGLYFTDSLFSGEMSMKWARIIGAHLLKQAKEHADGCGGDSRILTIPSDGEPIFATKEEIVECESYLAEIEDAMRTVLPSGNVTEDTLAHRLEMLNDAVKKARLATLLRVGPLEVTFKVGDWIDAAIRDGDIPSTPPAGSPDQSGPTDDPPTEPPLPE
jgi:20S proteasome alpha/beta subunit